MVFSTILFLFRFLPITLALYYLAPAKLKNTVLFLCSLVFYCWGEVRFFPIMIALILLNYLCGLGLERFDGSKPARKCFLLAGLVGSLGMLFYFKYANFVLSSANALLGTSFSPIQGISTLPLGISFYTFQTLSYTIDVYRRDVKTEHNIIDFGAYVVMFPQLIAGPIVKYRDVAAQLHVTHGRYNLKQIEDGMTLFTFGLAKKVLLADTIGALWTDIIGIAEDFIKSIIRSVLENCPDEMAFFDQWTEKGIVGKLTKVINSDFGRIDYTDAVKLLEESGRTFKYPVSWGCDLQTEHERYLTEQIFQRPVFVTDYPKDIKAFYMKLNPDGKTVAAMDCLVPGIGEIIGGSQREENLELLMQRMKETGMNTENYDFYLDLRKYGTTRHAGFGLGFERCVMYLTGISNIRDVIPFPRTTGNCEY